MRIPRPPAPIYAASVADAMISEAAVRTPEKASGKASGALTVSQRRAGLMPMPTPASMTSAGTLLNATAVLMRMGGMARTVSATTAGTVPTPRYGTQIMRIARLGITRRTPAVPVASRSLHACREHKMPSGTAMASAAASAMPLMARWSMTIWTHSAPCSEKYVVICWIISTLVQLGRKRGRVN